MVLGATSLVLETLFFALDPLFVHLELSFLFTHLVSQLLKHGDLFASLIVHDGCLHTHLRGAGAVRAVALLRV